MLLLTPNSFFNMKWHLKNNFSVNICKSEYNISFMNIIMSALNWEWIVQSYVSHNFYMKSMPLKLYSWLTMSINIMFTTLTLHVLSNFLKKKQLYIYIV